MKKQRKRQNKILIFKSFVTRTWKSLLKTTQKNIPLALKSEPYSFIFILTT